MRVVWNSWVVTVVGTLQKGMGRCAVRGGRAAPDAERMFSLAGRWKNSRTYAP